MRTMDFNVQTVYTQADVCDGLYIFFYVHCISLFSLQCCLFLQMSDCVMHSHD